MVYFLLGITISNPVPVIVRSGEDNATTAGELAVQPDGLPCKLPVLGSEEGIQVTIIFVGEYNVRVDQGELEGNWEVGGVEGKSQRQYEYGF